jgi:hypothetical protein
MTDRLTRARKTLASLRVWIAAGAGLVAGANIAAAAFTQDVLGEVSKLTGVFVFGRGMIALWRDSSQGER